MEKPFTDKLRELLERAKTRPGLEAEINAVFKSAEDGFINGKSTVTLLYDLMVKRSKVKEPA